MSDDVVRQTWADAWKHGLAPLEAGQLRIVAGTHPVEPLPLTEPHPFLSRIEWGGSFILDTPPDPVPLWGSGHDVLWAEGESLVIVGPQGTGKSTLGQQIALGRAGLPEYADLLGYPIKPADRRVLYLAMDRPRQIARSIRRMVGEAMRDELDHALAIWPGPPMFDLAKNTSLLAQMGDAVNASTIVVDSIKDAAIGLSDDEVGAGWNRARQRALQAGIELIELHHQRKSPHGGRQSASLDDVYGSTWITSGAGSVLMIGGHPGDPIVNLHHIKQPANEVGPFKAIHDHDTGRTAVWHATDLVAAASASPTGLTAMDAARLLFDADKPSPAQKEKARRRLDGLARTGLLRVLDEGDVSTKRSKLWGSP